MKLITNDEEEKIWDHDDSPPSYDSLFGQFKEAKEKSDGPLDLLKKAIELFAGTSELKIDNWYIIIMSIYFIVYIYIYIINLYHILYYNL